MKITMGRRKVVVCDICQKVIKRPKKLWMARNPQDRDRCEPCGMEFARRLREAIMKDEGC